MAQKPAYNPLSPSANLLIKLGSLVVHYQEMTSPGGHYLDKEAIKTLEEDVEIKAWFAAMQKMAFLPVKRS